MEKEIINFNHNINIIERKNILITGIKKVESFDKEEFLLDTIMGYLVIKGLDLELVKLDTKEGSISIKGLINCLEYLDELKKEKETSFLSKLFK